ncbi:hypothetical protein [Paenibacillus spongiae]
MSAGLIDECHLLLNPIFLGGGKRMSIAGQPPHAARAAR